VAMVVSWYYYSGVCDSVHAHECVTVFLVEGHKMVVKARALGPDGGKMWVRRGTMTRENSTSDRLDGGLALGSWEHHKGNLPVGFAAQNGDVRSQCE